jgi:hypothetical protein
VLLGILPSSGDLPEWSFIALVGVAFFLAPTGASSALLFGQLIATGDPGMRGSASSSALP